MQPNKHVCMLACSKKACFHAASYIVGADQKKKKKKKGGGGGGGGGGVQTLQQNFQKGEICIGQKAKGGGTPGHPPGSAPV